MSIPYIIHQTWRDSQVPAPARAMVASWRRLHRTWEYRLWTDQQNRRFIGERYPDFLRTYDAYALPIQRADAVRYFYLYEFGGVYVDLDVECLRPVDGLLVGNQCVLGLEPAEHSRIHGRAAIVGNAWMAAPARHPFIAAVLADLRTYASAETDPNTLVLDTTGPFMLGRVLEQHGTVGVTLLPSDYLYPFSSRELDNETPGDWSAAARSKMTRAYAVHYFVGTWWRPSWT